MNGDNGDRRLRYEGALFTVAIGLLLLWALRVADGWDELRASIIVFLLGGIGVCLAAVQLVMDLRSGHGGPKKEGIHFDAPALRSGSRWGNFEIWGWILGFYFAIRLIGFPTAVPLFVFGYAKTYGAGWLPLLPPGHRGLGLHLRRVRAHPPRALAGAVSGGILLKRARERGRRRAGLKPAPTPDPCTPGACM